MEYQWHDFLGNLGVLFIIGSYLLLQLEKLDSQSFTYLAANGFGATLVLISLLGEFNLSAFLIEFFWLIISIYGLIKNRHKFSRKVDN